MPDNTLIAQVVREKTKELKRRIKQLKAENAALCRSIVSDRANHAADRELILRIRGVLADVLADVFVRED